MQFSSSFGCVVCTPLRPEEPQGQQVKQQVKQQRELQVLNSELLFSRETVPRRVQHRWTSAAQLSKLEVAATGNRIRTRASGDLAGVETCHRPKTTDQR